MLEVDQEFNEKKPLCTAQDALLKVYTAIANALAAIGESDKKRKDKEECQLLAPSSQSANIIGKSGPHKEVEKQAEANIKVVARDASDPTHSCALEFDNFVLITGDPESVRRSLFAISAIIIDRELIHYREKRRAPLMVGGVLAVDGGGRERKRRR
ncbi:hypothetical protein KY285_032826 [Solanum tuberosum]|nr:hypothetical protein KY285_032826 [Solanum tuberosum]